MRTGAFSLVETALQAGVAVCFANPGTTELPIVAALDRAAGIRVVFGLFEGGPGPRAGNLYPRECDHRERSGHHRIGLERVACIQRSTAHHARSHGGGAIGQGLSTALAAGLACPDRRAIAFQADGSGLYTVQALWSMARESVDVTVVACANRRYRILQTELARAGIAQPGPKALALTDLSRPVIDWVAQLRGFGMPGCSRVGTDSELAGALSRALAERGPGLIEAVIG